MFKNRSFLRGLGTGFIFGAILLQLMIMVQDTGAQTQAEEQKEQPKQELSAELIREKAPELGLQVYDKSVVLYDQEALDEAVRKAAAEAKAQMKTAPSPITVYIPDGLRASQVIDTLVKAGVVKDRKAFEKELRKQEGTGKIRSGTFTFTSGEPLPDVVAKIIRTSS